MNFINPSFNSKNVIGIPPITEKIKLTKKDISLKFVLARNTPDGYKCRFLITINPMSLVNQGIQIKASQINMVSLHDAIIESIDPFDRKYMVLKSFDTMKCEFLFNFNKWFNDAISNVTPKKYLSRFDQEFKLRIQPPKMLIYDALSSNFFAVIAENFKKYVVNNNKENTWFGKLLPKDFQKTVNTKIHNLFEYEYDFQFNRLIVRLKPVYIVGLSFMVGMGLKEISEFKVNKKSFSERVEKNINNYNKDKWKDFIKKRFI